MNTIWRISLLLFVICLCYCRDYYIGMFKRNDFLVAQDRLYKERVPFHRVVAKYGRVFRCPITYFRVLDRLGYGGGPRVEVIRGGLRKKYIVARITSPYNIPISVNVYIGCENKMTTTKRTTTTTAARKDSIPDESKTTTGGDNGNSIDTEGDNGGQKTTKLGGNKEEENKPAETTKTPSDGGADGSPADGGSDGTPADGETEKPPDDGGADGTPANDETSDIPA